jgi:hypothetical protein
MLEMLETLLVVAVLVKFFIQQAELFLLAFLPSQSVAQPLKEALWVQVAVIQANLETTLPQQVGLVLVLGTGFSTLRWVQVEQAVAGLQEMEMAVSEALLAVMLWRLVALQVETLTMPAQAVAVVARVQLGAVPHRVLVALVALVLRSVLQVRQLLMVAVVAVLV